LALLLQLMLQLHLETVHVVDGMEALG